MFERRQSGFLPTDIASVVDALLHGRVQSRKLFGVHKDEIPRVAGEFASFLHNARIGRLEARVAAQNGWVTAYTPTLRASNAFYRKEVPTSTLRHAEHGARSLTHEKLVLPRQEAALRTVILALDPSEFPSKRAKRQ